MFLRGDIWRAVAINRLQAPTLLSLRDSRPAKTKASVQSTRPNIILSAFRCTDSIKSSRYKGIAAQTGYAYSIMDLTILQQTNTRSLVPSPTLLRVRSKNNRIVAFFMDTFPVDIKLTTYFLDICSVFFLFCCCYFYCTGRRVAKLEMHLLLSQVCIQSSVSLESTLSCTKVVNCV